MPLLAEITASGALALTAFATGYALLIAASSPSCRPAARTDGPPACPGWAEVFPLPEISGMLDAGEGDVSWMGPSTADEVTVPDIVGLTVTQARKVAWEAGLVIAAADPDGPPVRALTWPGVWAVTAQHPAPGSRMRRRGSLVIEFKKSPGGEAEDREPSPPSP